MTKLAELYLSVVDVFMILHYLTRYKILSGLDFFKYYTMLLFDYIISISFSLISIALNTNSPSEGT